MIFFKKHNTNNNCKKPFKVLFLNFKNKGPICGDPYKLNNSKILLLQSPNARRY